ncbi:MAG: hypothetical protein ACRDNF_19705 [Streptosporangiaceae bacterium]
MTQPADDHAPSPGEAVRARNRLARHVRALLKGSGLDIRENDNQLVISRPGHPDHGRIYITYATAEVSHALTLYTYLGHLDQHASSPDNDEPPVDTKAIIDALTDPSPDGSPP